MSEMNAIKLNQLKKASEAYAELRVLHTDPLTDEVDDEFPVWSLFRDGFIADWTSNRIIVDEKEADVMYDTIANEALAVIEAAEAGAVSTEVEVPTVAAVETAPVEAVVAKRRRGRPAGAKVEGATKKSYYKPKAKTEKSTKPKKVAAKKKSTASASSKAQAIVEKYKERAWSRKDIIAKIQEQLEMGVAYASTLYQKFA